MTKTDVQRVEPLGVFQAMLTVKGCLLQEFDTLLRFSGAAKREAVRNFTGMNPALGVSSAEKLSDDIRLRYSASSAVTNGLEECMEEAEHEEGREVSAALEGAVLTILREIGEDPGREVKFCLKSAHAVAVLYGPNMLLFCEHVTERAVVRASAEPGCVTMQGLRGSAQRYVRFLLASTAGYKEPMLHQDGCMDTCSVFSQQSRRQAPLVKELHVHFMSHCEHHMLPFHGQASCLSIRYR